MRRLTVSLLTTVVCLAVWACAPLEPARIPTGMQGGNAPLFVRANNEEVVWERAIDVLHDYQFEIARENRLDGIIETRPKVGSSLLEPWHRETIGFSNRLESTLQSIRRRAIVTITPGDGGYLVGVEALKEREDLVGIAENTTGGAVFQEANPLQRDLNLVVGQSAPSGWIPLGRDPVLERSMLRRLQRAYCR